MKTISIKGKDYVTVNERLKAFRTAADYIGWQLLTKVHILNSEECAMEAQIFNKEGVMIANGFAFERRNQAGSMVNSTSHVENCETSAWGRALGNLGIGIDESICSAQELLIALNNQQSQTQAKPLSNDLKKQGNKLVVEKPKNAQNAGKMVPMDEDDSPLLTEEEQSELTGIYADIDACLTSEQLHSICNMYRMKKYIKNVEAHCYTRAKELGINKK